MPGLLKRSAQFCGGGCGGGCGGSDGIWSKHRGDITAAQLQKFWNALPYHARRELLKIDKQTLFEQARKNLYCSRCNGLLLEGFSQIIMYGKSLQLEDAGTFAPDGTMQSEMEDEIEIDDTQDPSVHPWGGLATTRDGILTLLDCFINAKSLKALQNVFDNARARERERELLYPDACGGGGRGWISQGIASYGRGHGIRDTCALHTARLSCDTLVDFWSALSDDTRLSLLRMKEEDFIERLMYRFDSKRFCRDCRRNVIREFKELKELKRMRREPHCSSCFCVADTALQYEVLSDAVQVDWHRSFTDSFGTYHRFEWAIGTAEGKSDILDFEDVGTIGKVHVTGLDLGGFGACFITVRAWKLDGRCTELCVKAHALRGKPCVHRRLIVGDGYVTITKGDSIQRFFEHAEEAEEEEDDDAMDKDGNEYDDGSRPQKHAKSPELAREFLLDAASVIFKEQVEKAFREGTARQNAHSVFVCLALKLLEERIHVACKEIITLEKQIRLLEEEEKEKREEEERKERRRTKEREKKLRRKERLKGKERERERKDTDSNSPNLSMPTSNNDLPTSPHDEPTTPLNNEDSISEPGGIHGTCDLVSPETTDQLPVDGCVDSNDPKNGSMWHECHVHEETNSRDGNDSFALEQAKSSRRKLRDQNDCFVDQPSKWFINGAHRPTRERVLRNNSRNCNPNSYEKVYGSNGRTCDRHNFGPCACNQQDHRMKDEYHIREAQATNNSEFLPDAPRPQYHSMKYNRGCYAPAPDGCAAPKGKLVPVRDGIHTKQVWEPIDARKKWARSISDPDITWRTVSTTGSFKEVGIDKNEHQCGTSNPKPLSSHQAPEDCIKRSNKSDTETVIGNHNGFVLIPKSDCYSAEEDAKSCPSMPTQNARDSSSSDNCSCISELDSGASLSPQNAGSLSPSDSEDTSPQSAVSTCQGSQGSAFGSFPVDDTESQPKDARIGTGVPVSGCAGASAVSSCHDRFGCDMAALQQQHIVPIYNQSMHGSFYPSLPIGYHNQTAPSWLAAPTNGFVPYAAAQHTPYMFPSPFGYGQPPDFQLQYNTVQLLAPPMLNLAQHPMYQPNNGIYVGCPEEQIKHRNILVAQENTDAPDKVHPLKTKPPPVVAQKGDAGNVAKASGETPSFSLFHFGGPVAATVSVSVKEEAADAASVLSLPRSMSNLSCSTEDTKVEEYSLFSGRAMLDFHSACDFIK